MKIVTTQVPDSLPPAAARSKKRLRTTVECRAILPGGQVMRARVVRSLEQLLKILAFHAP